MLLPPFQQKPWPRINSRLGDDQIHPGLSPPCLVLGLGWRKKEGERNFRVISQEASPLILPPAQRQGKPSFISFRVNAFRSESLMLAQHLIFYKYCPEHCFLELFPHSGREKSEALKNSPGLLPYSMRTKLSSGSKDPTQVPNARKKMSARRAKKRPLKKILFSINVSRKLACVLVYHFNAHNPEQSSLRMTKREMKGH